MPAMSLTMRTIALPLLALGMSACGGDSAPATADAGRARRSGGRRRSTSQAARFAPTELSRRHRQRCRSHERKALDAHDSRRAGDGRAVSRDRSGRATRRCCWHLLRDQSPIGRARLHYFLINKGPWSRLDHNEPFVPGAPAEAGRGQLLRRRRDQGRSGEVAAVVAGAGPGARHRVLHDDPPRPGRRLHRRALQHRISGRARRSPRCTCVRRPKLTAQPTLKAFLESRAAAFLIERLLRQRREVDGARRLDRADHRPLRGLRGRVVQLQGRVRGVHHRQGRQPSRRSCRSSPARCRTIENNLPIDPKYRNPKLGALAPIAVVNTVFSAGDANRGVQTAAFNLPNDERVIREKGSKRVMLKNNQEAKFSKVLVPISRVALAAGRSGQRRVRRVLHPHPDARADARPRPARHHRGRPRDHRAPGAEGDLQRHRGSEGRHRRAVRAAVPGRQRATRQGRSSGRCTRRSWRRRSARSASASPKRTAAARRFS